VSHTSLPNVASSATQCDSLQLTATHCAMLPRTHLTSIASVWSYLVGQRLWGGVSDQSLQHDSTHCNTPRHTAVHCQTLHTLQHALTYCNHCVGMPIISHCNTFSFSHVHSLSRALSLSVYRVLQTRFCTDRQSSKCDPWGKYILESCVYGCNDK